MARRELWKFWRSTGFKTDLWLTADKEVLPLTAKNPELQWSATKASKAVVVSALSRKTRRFLPSGGFGF
jgi:hypothetical protein